MIHNERYYGPCRHCKNSHQLYGRGLCWTCYKVRSIRNEYLRYKPGKKADGSEIINAHTDDREPTEEELERIIAEQWAALPGWWESETQLEREIWRLLRTYTVVRCT